MTEPATAKGPSSARDTASIGTGGTTVIESISRNGSAEPACRLHRLPTARPSPPRRVNRTGSSVARRAAPHGARRSRRARPPRGRRRRPAGRTAGRAAAAGEQHREGRRGLQDQRGQARRHPRVHSQVEEQELPARRSRGRTRAASATARRTRHEKQLPDLDHDQRQPARPRRPRRRRARRLSSHRAGPAALSRPPSRTRGRAPGRGRRRRSRRRPGPGRVAT